MIRKGQLTGVSVGLAIILVFSQSLWLAGCREPEATAPPVVFITESPAGSRGAFQPASEIALANTEPDADNVRFEGVGFAAEGAYIAVYFKAPPQLVDGWWQGSVYVIDEATNQIFSEVPVMPVIGPLIAKPKEDGQPGYFMLNNAGRAISAKSLLTVVLGKYKRVHVPMQ
jgi:hypothetical protein